MTGTKKDKGDAHFIETMILAGYGLCDECEGVVDGNAEGWHDHTVHGEGNVCENCCDTEDE